MINIINYINLWIFCVLSVTNIIGFHKENTMWYTTSSIKNERIFCYPKNFTWMLCTTGDRTAIYFYLPKFESNVIWLLTIYNYLFSLEQSFVDNNKYKCVIYCCRVHCYEVVVCSCLRLLTEAICGSGVALSQTRI